MWLQSEGKRELTFPMTSSYHYLHLVLANESYRFEKSARKAQNSITSVNCQFCSLKILLVLLGLEIYLGKHYLEIVITSRSIYYIVVFTHFKSLFKVIILCLQKPDYAQVCRHMYPMGNSFSVFDKLRKYDGTETKATKFTQMGICVSRFCCFFHGLKEIVLLIITGASFSTETFTFLHFFYMLSSICA